MPCRGTLLSCISSSPGRAFQSRKSCERSTSSTDQKLATAFLYMRWNIGYLQGWSASDFADCDPSCPAEAGLHRACIVSASF